MSTVNPAASLAVSISKIEVPTRDATNPQGFISNLRRWVPSIGYSLKGNAQSLVATAIANRRPLGTECTTVDFTEENAGHLKGHATLSFVMAPKGNSHVAVGKTVALTINNAASFGVDDTHEGAITDTFKTMGFVVQEFTRDPTDGAIRIELLLPEP